MSSRSYVSSSDDSRRPRHPGPPPPPPPPPPFNNGPPKPKRKKKLPPQDSIDRIWARFSVPKFSKALSILPKTAASSISVPVPAAATAQSCSPTACPRPHDNLLVHEDYERAVQECRTRVRKLIRECKRVNMRYRDPTFDIDWDLKWEKGYCLNSLGAVRFELEARRFPSPLHSVPKAVKRVHEIFDKPSFLQNKINPADVKQGSVGDCWLMASFTALANMEYGVKRICVEYDERIGIYGFVFHRDGEWVISIIDDKLYLKSPDWDSPSVQRHLLEQTDGEDIESEYRKTYQTGSQSLFFAHCQDQNETWVPLLEKAYAKAHGDYAALTGGWIGEGLEDLTGGVTTELLTSDILDVDEFWDNEIMKVNKEFLFGCSTGLLDGGYGHRDGISEGHAYIIMEARELELEGKRERLLKLRNPWGKGKKGNWEGPWSDGSKEFTPEAQIALKHKFGNDSVFWISYPDLLRKYQHFDRTRLFMDSPDWRVTQKWISMEVPWRAEFEQRFHLVLTKESPVVLVLSQLDARYFDGLQGQYSFRLQFRLHEIDSAGEDDYIVRSHGNYLMERSVVTELLSLPAGTYSVFVMIVADRNADYPSVEDVVKRECRRKSDNEKLAKVGAAYDLAHSKGVAHFEARIENKKDVDMAKARETRIALRQKHWERGHLYRVVTRKQEKKDRAKREQKGRAKQEQKFAQGAAEIEERNRLKPKHQGVQTDPAVESVAEKEDKAIQTEAQISLENMIEEPQSEEMLPPLNELDKATQTDEILAFEGSPSTQDTPKSYSLPISPHNHENIPMPGSPLPPPPPPRPDMYYPYDRGDPTTRFAPPPPLPPGIHYAESEVDTDASPISDFEQLISDDDPSLRPRKSLSGRHGTKGERKDDESEDEDTPDPWNAVCIVGLRVYSQDDGLVVKIFDAVEEEANRLKAKEEEKKMKKKEEKKIEEEEKVAAASQADEGEDGDVEDLDDEEGEIKGGEKKEKEEKKVEKGEDKEKEKEEEKGQQGPELKALENRTSIEPGNSTPSATPGHPFTSNKTGAESEEVGDEARIQSPSCYTSMEATEKLETKQKDQDDSPHASDTPIASTEEAKTRIETPIDAKK